MATRVLLVSLFLSLLVACEKKEDDINPGTDYSGSLTLSYSRTFPTFDALVTIPVEISSAGLVTFAECAPVEFKGESQKMIEGERIKVKEQGVISISNLSGEWTKQEGKEYLKLNLTCQLEGRQEVWKYEVYQWEKMSDLPVMMYNPVDGPLLFRIENAVMSEAVCGCTHSDTWGNLCFRWHLVLHRAGQK